ncbi:MAG: aminoglycoside phosphotransferase family protein [bacterium]
MTDLSIELIAFKLLKEYKSKKIFDFSLTPLFGDASGREYFRVSFGKETAVLMKVADVKPGEFGRGDSFNDFIALRNLFNASGVRVPEIYSVILEQKSLLLEDLGDTTLFQMIENDKKNKSKHVKSAVDLLVDTQNKLYNRESFNSPADKRSFDKKLFMEEFYHFYEYMIAKRVYDKPFKGVWTKLEKEFKQISHELSTLPTLLSHRDFQSKNIMIKGGTPYLIDFQDALIAPALYDLVSLLRDSYVTLSDDEVEALLNYYWETNQTIQELFTSFEDIKRAFYLQTVQRKMKDAGRFIYLNQVKGKEWFIPFVVPTLKYVKSALLTLEMERIIEILAPFIPEFNTRSQN